MGACSRVSTWLEGLDRTRAVDWGQAKAEGIRKLTGLWLELDQFLARIRLVSRRPQFFLLETSQIPTKNLFILGETGHILKPVKAPCTSIKFGQVPPLETSQITLEDKSSPKSRSNSSHVPARNRSHSAEASPLGRGEYAYIHIYLYINIFLPTYVRISCETGTLSGWVARKPNGQFPISRHTHTHIHMLFCRRE